METRIAAPRRGKGTPLLLVLVTLLAAGLRVYHLGYGLEKGYPVPAYDLDELGVIDPIFSMLQAGNVDPQIYVHPHLLHYTILALSLPARERIAAGDMRLMVMVGRSVVAAAGLLTIPLTFLLAVRLGRGRGAALLAALFLALSVFHIRESRFIMMDVFQTFFLVAAAAVMYDIAVSPTWRRYLASGALIGLALGAKQSSLLALVVLAAVHFLFRPGPARRKLADLKFYAAAALALAVFAAASPFALLHAKEFLKDFLLTSLVAKGAIVMEWHADFLAARPISDDLVNLLWGMGPSLLLAAGGLLLALRRRSAPDLYALLWLVFFAAPVVLTYSKYSRYYVPLLPFLSIFAGDCADAGWNSLRGPVRRGVWAGVVALIAGAQLFYAFAFVSIYSGKDPRTRARDWLAANLPSPAVVYVDAKAHYMPQGFDPKHLRDVRTIELVPLVDRNRAYRGLPVPNRLFAALRARGLFADYNRFDLDTDEKAYFDRVLHEADYIVESDFNLEKYARVAGIFPVQYGFYRDLFAGRLGFRPVAVFRNRPRLFGFEFAMPTTDICCRHFDQGTVTVFRKERPRSAL